MSIQSSPTDLVKCGVIILVLISAAGPRSRVLPVQIQAVKVVPPEVSHRAEDESAKKTSVSNDAESDKKENVSEYSIVLGGQTPNKCRLFVD